MTQVNNFAALVAAVNATEGKVMDDHRGAGWLRAGGIANLVRDDKTVPVLLLRHTSYFSLNLMYVGENGEARVSRDSVGGCVKLMGASLEDGILAYNEGQKENLFTSSFLTDIHFLVEGKLVASDMVTMEQVVEMQTEAKAAHDAWKKDYDARQAAKSA